MWEVRASRASYRNRKLPGLKIHNFSRSDLIQIPLLIPYHGRAGVFKWLAFQSPYPTALGGVSHTRPHLRTSYLVLRTFLYQHKGVSCVAEYNSKMATTSDITRNCFIRHENVLLKVIEYDHITPGKGNTIYSCKCRNVETGKQSEVRFRSGEKIDLVRVDELELQYIYSENEFLVCMNQETFEQIHIPKVIFGDTIQFLQEGMILKIRFDETEKPLNGELPKYVELTVTYTEDGNKGKLIKPAEVEGGIKISVPMFVNIGDKLKIDTETGEYVERVMK